MAIYDMNGSAELLRQLHAANAAEGAATRELLAAMQGGRDVAELAALSDRFEAAHSHTMDIWDALEKFKLGD